MLPKLLHPAPRGHRAPRLAFPLALLLAASLAGQEAAGGLTVTAIEHRIKGRVLESALDAYLGIEPGMGFPDLAAAGDFAATASRRLRTNRVFTMDSRVEIEALDRPGELRLIVSATTSITALAVPYPKYSSDDGFSLAIRYKDFNFLGSLEPMTLSFDYRAAAKELSLGADFSMPFPLGGFDAEFSLDGKLFASPEGFGPTGSLDLELDRPLPALGPGWSLVPVLGYSYGESDNTHSLRGGTSLVWRPWDSPLLSLSAGSGLGLSYQEGFFPSLWSNLRASSSIGLGAGPGGIPLALELSTGPGLSLALDSLELDVLGWTGSASLGGDDIDLHGNQRVGRAASLELSTALYAHRPAGEASRTIELGASLSHFRELGRVLGLELRALATWSVASTLYGTAGSYPWEDVFRGRRSRLRGDLGIAANLQMPINFAQGRFFGLELLSAEVFAIPFLDLGVVRVDRTELFGAADQGMACGGLEMVVYPDKARSFAYRLSVGTDLKDLAASGELGPSSFEIWLGLGLHF